MGTGELIEFTRLSSLAWLSPKLLVSKESGAEEAFRPGTEIIPGL